jgi:hypothetical protein
MWSGVCGGYGYEWCKWWQELKHGGNLIILYSLKTSLFWNLKTRAREHGYLIFFISWMFVHFFQYYFLNNFCIAYASFATKL